MPTDASRGEVPKGLYFHVNWGRLALQRGVLRASGRLARVRFGPLIRPASLPSGWVELRPRLAGVCGSDITLLKGHASPYLRPLTSFPAVLGHEVVAELADSGTRVVVEPTLSCAARRLPPCQMCAMGQSEDCLRRRDPGLGAGLMLGFHSRLPGGWSQQMWAPEEQLVVVPDAMPDERAVLTEPAAIVLNGLRQVDWHAAKEVLVVGAGTLGLLAAALVSELYPATTITVQARHPRQAQLAHELGAAHVLRGGDGVPDVHRVTGEPLRTMPGYAPYYPRGFDVVIVAAGSTSAIAASLRWAAPGAQVLMLGGAGHVSLDLTPVWSRHLRVLGSYGYGESGVDTFRAVLSLFSVMHQPLEALVTHQFGLRQHKQALNLVTVQRQEVVKAVFRPD